MSARPPRAAEGLLEPALPRAFREAILGDLAEEFAEHILPERGLAGARRWYWRQVLRSLVPALVWRLRRRSPGGSRTGPMRTPRRQGDGPMRSLVHDLRYTGRTVRKSPGFAAVAVLTLGLGIGANAVVYGVVDGMVLNPFPFPEPDRLVGVGTAYPRLGAELSFWENASAPEYADVEERSRTLRDVVAWDMGNRQLSREGGMPQRVFTAFWWGDAFPTLGMPPHLGRGFRRDEIEGGERVAIISHRLWSSTFAGDSSVVGRTVRMNGEPYTLIGVMPPRALIYGTDLWLPMWADAARMPRDRRQFQIMARLAPGATLEEANAELETIARRVESAYGAEFEGYAGWRMTATPWTEVNVRTFKPAALILLGAVGFVLLLVCVNVASLLLSRAAGRRREIAVRAALGASRGRIARQLLTESVTLALIGGAVGAALAVFGVRGFQAMLATLPIPVAGQVELNARVLAYTAGASVLAGVLFGLIPAFQASRSDVQGMLKGGEAGVTRWSRQRLQRVFLAAEVALTLVLLVGGGLLAHSFLRMQRVDPGFDTSDVLTVRLTLPWERYEGAAITNFFERLVRGVETIPGVERAAAGTQFPPIGFSRNRFTIEGRQSPVEGAVPVALTTIVSHDYFEALGLPLTRGRTFNERDGPDAPFVAVVNQAAADRYFPGEDPVGQRVRVGGGDSGTPWATIVGVVGSARNRGLDSSPEPELFANLRQTAGWTNQLFLLVRTGVDPPSVLPAVRETVRSLDPDQSVYAIQTVEQAFAAGAAPRRIATFVLGSFGLFALILAVVGVYGVASYAVAQRTREIGVRMALGAGAGQVRRLVVRQALLPVAVGAAVGLAGALAVGRLLSGLLFQIGGTDPLTIAAVGLLLGGVALVASWVPARRASRVDPVGALRRG